MRLLHLLVGTLVILGIGEARAEGNAERGQPLTALCMACHGPDGNSITATFPNIAGQNAQYLLKQMQEFKSNARSAPLMTGMLTAFNDQQLEDIAAYYSKQKANRGNADPALVELGESIYRSGINRKNIAACSSCHSPTGSGNGPAGFPALSGQWPGYTEAQLKAFRAGERTNDGDSRMMQIMTLDLSDPEIAAVSSYLYGLH
jgi:cytochrome c553|tara:strand:- start:212 stop:820 length:609 start_codon:yes stop_codon:yes gene_type:complete